MRITVGSTTIHILQGDITRESVDAVVNAANSSLLGGGGVDGAIHRAGGPAIVQECKVLGRCATGDAKITTAGLLPARYVIHTVGPVYRDGKNGEAELLSRCHQRCLEVAVENAARTVAFPAISCGIYGYPISEAARIAVGTVVDFLEDNADIDEVRFVLFGEDTYGPFLQALKQVRA
jgi:O-acetyl-ADP-ribose deacetylase (regulator of RNase III)